MRDLVGERLLKDDELGLVKRRTAEQVNGVADLGDPGLHIRLDKPLPTHRRTQHLIPLIRDWDGRVQVVDTSEFRLS